MGRSQKVIPGSVCRHGYSYFECETELIQHRFESYLRCLVQSNKGKYMKRIIIAVVASIAAIIGLSTAPAQAATTYTIWHGSDGGYDARFTLKCASGAMIYVPEFHNSTEQCPGGVTDIYVHANEEIHCFFYNSWTNQYDSEGWHKIVLSQTCVAQRD
jgi:hypothetical protein